jgi:hypothetical protein
MQHNPVSVDETRQGTLAPIIGSNKGLPDCAKALLCLHKRALWSFVAEFVTLCDTARHADMSQESVALLRVEMSPRKSAQWRRPKR